MEAVARARVLFDESRKLKDIAARAFARNVAIYRTAEVRVRRTQRVVAESHRVLERHGVRRTTRLLRLLIGARIDEGRLPQTIPPTIPGSPGFGGACAACDGYMPPTRLMMLIPDGDAFVDVHAECYVIWAAQCRLRQILRRFE